MALLLFETLSGSVRNWERNCNYCCRHITFIYLYILYIYIFLLRRTDEEIQEMIEEADRDNDDQISPDEFLRIMKKRSGNPIDELSSDED